MTYQEAIRILKTGTISVQEKLRARDIAISALEKQAPRKPVEVAGAMDIEYVCTCCNAEIDELAGNFCPGCGQAIDWSGEDESTHTE